MTNDRSAPWVSLFLRKRNLKSCSNTCIGKCISIVKPLLEDCKFKILGDENNFGSPLGNLKTIVYGPLQSHSLDFKVTNLVDRNG